MSRWGKFLICSAMLFAVPANAEEADGAFDLADAKKAFSTTCMACHSDKSGANGLGPSLFGVVGREAGTVDGFNYSDAMKQSDVVWTREMIGSFIQNAKTVVPGNRMGVLFPVGVGDDLKRNKILFYLDSLSEN